MEQSMLERHNEQRARHGVSPLVLDDELTKGAEELANAIAFKNCEIYSMDVIVNRITIYSSDSTERPKVTSCCGVNVGIYQGKREKYSMISDEELGLFQNDLWYNEVENYPWSYFNGTDGDEEDEHKYYGFESFSQIVWKNTTNVGFAIRASSVLCVNPQVVVVALYWPEGNADPDNFTEYVENVLPFLY